jgi:hypothetical protein
MCAAAPPEFCRTIHPAKDYRRASPHLFCAAAIYESPRERIFIKWRFAISSVHDSLFSNSPHNNSFQPASIWQDPLAVSDL